MPITAKNEGISSSVGNGESASQRWNNVMQEFVLRNEVHFVTQVTGIVCVCAVKEGLLIRGLCEACPILEWLERSLRSFQPEPAALPIEVD